MWTSHPTLWGVTHSLPYFGARVKSCANGHGSDDIPQYLHVGLRSKSTSTPRTISPWVLGTWGSRKDQKLVCAQPRRGHRQLSAKNMGTAAPSIITITRDGLQCVRVHVLYTGLVHPSELGRPIACTVACTPVSFSATYCSSCYERQCSVFRLRLYRT